MNPVLKTPLLWTSLAFSLLSGFSSQIILAAYPEAFVAHWFRNAPLLLALHLSTLGFVGLLVLGVLTQFLPMLLGRALSSTLWAALALAAFFLGSLMLWSFFSGQRSSLLAALAGLSLTLSLAIFLGLSLKALTRGDGHALTKITLASSLGYFIATALLGSLLAQGLVRAPLLSDDPLSLIELHLHLGLFGFAALMIFGVSYELLPMFGLAKGYSLRMGWLALLLGHLGILSLAFSVFANSRVAAQIWPWALSAACLAWSAQVFGLVKASVRKQREPGPLHFRACVLWLLAGVLWGLRLKVKAASGLQPNPGESSAYVYLLLFGFVGGAIFSQLQKILPLLSWYDRFAKEVGKAKVPSAAELLPWLPSWLAPIFHLLATGLGFFGFVFSSSSLLRASGLFGVACFATIALIWLACRRRGEIQPFLKENSHA